jgi:SepF-like predicted cell division protein (DUF552 family)
MTRTSPEDRFREAAEAEGGISVSAGARTSHVRMAVEAGRVFYVDLSNLPEDDRPAVIAEIKQTVERAVAKAGTGEMKPARKSSAG